MTHERNCTVCGKQYKYCPKCSQYDNMEKWHIEYCSEQCKNTYLTVNKYAFKHINKEEAKMLLEGNNINTKTELLPKFKEYVEEIFKVDKKVVVDKEETKTTEKSSVKPSVKKTTRKKKDIVNED